jgi:peptidylprolyl isomerase
MLVTIVGISSTMGCTGKEELATAKDGDMVKVHYKGTLEDGSIFDTSRDREPLGFKLGSGSMITGFDRAVNGMQVGEIKTLIIPAEEAYGPHRDDLVLITERDRLPEGLEPSIGQQLEMNQPDGSTIRVVITDITEASITLDANHRLAGKDLTFEIELVEID